MSCRFWSKVETGDPGACWRWLGSRIGGHGSFNIGGRPRIASRVSWTLTNGTITDGLYVLHKCDNRPCVNPAHLYLGTQADNVLDMLRKGHYKNAPKTDEEWLAERSRLRIPNCHATAKVNEEQVVEIRERYASGDVTHEELSKEYSVSRVSIANITLGHTWKHTGGPITRHWKRAPNKNKKRTRLTDDDVRNIRMLRGNGIKRKDIAADFKISMQTVTRICQRKTWRHVD